MYPYQKPQMDLLFDLIKEANPGIEFPFTPSTMKVGIPVAQAVPPGGIADTNIVVSPRTNDHWFGTVKVQYRRLALANIFKNMTPLTLDYYSPTVNSTVGTFIDNVNKLFGTSFLQNDFGFPPGTALSANGQFALTPVTGNLCYSPSNGAVCVWRNIKPYLREVTTKGILNGRLYPGGNDFVTPGRKPQGEYLAYTVDNTSPVMTGSNIGSGTIGPTTAWETLLAPLKAADPRFTAMVGHNVAPGGLNGLSFVTYTLPNALAPDANSALYKYVTVIVSQASSWFQGRLLLHYN